MKTFFRSSLFSFFITLVAQASGTGTFRVESPHGKVLYTVSGNWKKGSTVGTLSIDLLENAKAEGILTYEGYPTGILSINGVGNELVVPENSDTEMKAYGWCFTLNGELTDTLTDETFLETGTEEIVWFYGFAHYLDGHWISMCERDAPSSD
jgi:hypothetical protein